MELPLSEEDRVEIAEHFREAFMNLSDQLVGLAFLATANQYGTIHLALHDILINLGALHDTTVAYLHKEREEVAQRN